jgi:sulfur carrier protein ThiS
MKVKINTKEHEFPPGTKLDQVARMVRDANEDDPVTKSLVERTGKDHITFVHNGKIIKHKDYNTIELREGDEIRWIYPYAGG